VHRVAERRAALIETGLDCLHDDGLSGVSVRSICTRARLTPRYFYGSFADLDQLLVAVVDSVAAEVAARALDAIRSAPADLPAQVRAVIDAGYGVVATDRRKATALLVAAAGHGRLAERRQQIVIEYAELALAYLPAFQAFDDRRTATATVWRVVDQLTALRVPALTP
jgi:AcrR family transcriptional regulator